MKVFYSGQTGKINFVDDNNCFIGFDSRQCCCESFGWLITREIPEETSGTSLDESEYSDAQFVASFDPIKKDYINEEGGQISFKLESPHGTMYLTLFNCHNGYYGHGFTVDIGGVKWDDYL